MRKKLWLVALFFVILLPLNVGIVNGASREISLSSISLPPLIGQIAVGKTIVAELSGRYLTVSDEWKNEEKFFLHVKKISFTFPPIGTHPQVIVSGAAYERHKTYLGQFKATIVVLSSQFFQFSTTLNRQDGMRFAYEGDLFLVGEKLKGTFISEMREQTNSCPTEIGSGKTELYIE